MSDDQGSLSTIDTYRLSREGITVSMIGEDGVIKTYKQGDEVRITGRKAKEIGAVKVEEDKTNQEVIKTVRNLGDLEQVNGVIYQPTVTVTESTNSSSLDLSSISHLPFDKAIDLIGKISTLSDLKLAEEIETKGKKRRSVLEAINGRRNQIGNVK